MSLRPVGGLGVVQRKPTCPAWSLAEPSSYLGIAGPLQVETEESSTCHGTKLAQDSRLQLLLYLPATRSSVVVQ